MMHSVRSRVFTSCAILMAFGVLMIGLALLLPKPAANFSASEGALLINHEELGSAQVLSFSSQEQSWPGNVNLIIEEPDVLPTFDEFLEAILVPGELNAALENNTLLVKSTNGDVLLSHEERRISDLPALFWLQFTYVLIAGFICALIWVPGERSVAMSGFMLTGLGLMICIAGAAVYSTRELFIGQMLYQFTHGMNIFGSLLFGSGLMIFAWSCPKKILPKWVILLMLAPPFLGILLVVTRSLGPMQLVFYGPHVIMSLIALVGIAVQWRLSRSNALDRAKVRWVLASVIVGPLVFVGVAMIPALLGLPALSDQAVMLGVFLFMYFCLFWAVRTQSVFNLERWSKQVWLWMAGGLLVLSIDLIIASLVGLSGPATLTLALALVGWVYFPLRQWIWRKTYVRDQPGLESWLSQSLPKLLSEPTKLAGVGRVAKALGAVFEPLETRVAAKTTADTQVQNSGLKLVVPLKDKFQVELEHPAQGRRLFNTQDVKQAASVLALGELIEQSLSAKEEGVLEERTRIQHDLHDDLGAKLLRLLHRVDAPNQTLVREALSDLRLMLSHQSAVSQPLDVWWSAFEQTAAHRAADHGLSAEFTLKGEPAGLTLTNSTEFGKVVTEALSNCMKHAAKPHFSVEAAVTNNRFSLVFVNPVAAEATPAQGVGLVSMKTRMEKMNGSFSAELVGSGDTAQWRCCVAVEVA